MTTKTKETSRILDAVHETARDLHAAGFVSKRRMKEYDGLSLSHPAQRAGRMEPRASERSDALGKEPQ